MNSSVKVGPRKRTIVGWRQHVRQVSENRTRQRSAPPPPPPKRDGSI